MVQVVLLDTEANIPKYSNSPETIITTTNYTPKRSVDMMSPPSAHAGSGVILRAKDRVCHYSSETQNQRPRLKAMKHLHIFEK